MPVRWVPIPEPSSRVATAPARAIAFAAAGAVPGLAGVLLFYPVTDLSRLGETESYRRFGDGAAGLSLDDMQWSARQYAPERPSRQDWRCSPLLFGERVRLPPAFVATAEYDVLRSEGEALAKQLAARGSSVEHHPVQGVNHGYLGAGDAVPQAGATLAAAAAWIKTLVHSTESRQSTRRTFS